MNIKKPIKDKVKSKMVKTERKAARKAKTARRTACAVALAAALAGCQRVPSRSQTLTLSDCTITIYGGSDTNGLASAEIATQAMSIENSGTETLTPSQTTDVKPDVDVTVGGKATGGGGLLETVANKLMEGTTASESVADGKVSETCTDCMDR